MTAIVPEPSSPLSWFWLKMFDLPLIQRLVFTTTLVVDSVLINPIHDSIDTRNLCSTNIRVASFPHTRIRLGNNRGEFCTTKSHQMIDQFRLAKGWHFVFLIGGWVDTFTTNYLKLFLFISRYEFDRKIFATRLAALGMLSLLSYKITVVHCLAFQVSRFFIQNIYAQKQKRFPRKIAMEMKTHEKNKIVSTFIFFLLLKFDILSVN